MATFCSEYAHLSQGPAQLKSSVKQEEESQTTGRIDPRTQLMALQFPFGSL